MICWYPTPAMCRLLPIFPHPPPPIFPNFTPAPPGMQPPPYYPASSFPFPEGDPAQTSNGVVNNHIPLDPVQAAITVTKSVNETAVAEGAIAGDTLTYTVQ